MNDITSQITLSGILLLVIGILEVGIEIFAVPLTTDEILEQEWTKFSFGSPSISFELPQEPRRARLPQIPEELWEYIMDIESYSYKEAEAYQFMANMVTYIPFINVDLKGAAKGAIEEMKNQKGILNLKFKENPYTLGKLTGIMQTGTFEKNETVFEFTSVYFVRHKTMWQVIMVNMRGDTFGRKITERILKSVRIDVK